MTKAETMTKHESATTFGARNLFRFNACWSRGAKSLQSLWALRSVMRTEVRAPSAAGCDGFDVRCSMFDVRCFDSGSAATRFGARNLFRFTVCWPRAAKSLQSLCAVRDLMRTDVRAPVGCGRPGLGYFLAKFSQAATTFGARNLFRFNAWLSRGAKALESLCAVRDVMRTEVRAPVGCGRPGLGYFLA